MERRFAVHAGAYRQALIATLAIVLASGSAAATPTTKPARAAFDRAVSAYTKANFALASELFAKSYNAESDPDTLFGWAQSERKLGHCDKAVELYERLLSQDIPAQNKDAVKEPLAECKAVVEAATPKPEVKPESKPEVKPEVKPEPKPEPEDEAARVLGRWPEPAPEARRRGRAWWRDPIGDSFVGLGVVGLGVGTALLVSGHSADQDAHHTQNYFAFQTLEQKAHDRGEQGVIAIVAGGALVAAGIVWYVTHRDHPEKPAVTGWLAPTGGGVALGGGF